MTDTGERYAQHMEAASQAVGRGDRSAAIEALNAAIDVTDGHPSLLREHVAALNELSRLHIRQSDFAGAEPVLRRLLAIMRTKGDRHPDVATALAGLAVAKGGQGHHAAAELLFRNALQIREQTLAPDHMATVITLEQLADTCAARGNLAEALIHLQRALLRRERVLGADHATVQSLRARMAELERRSADPGAPADEAPTPAATPATDGASDTAWLTRVETAAQVAPAPPEIADLPAAPAPPARFYRRRTTRYASVGAAVLVLASAGFAFGSRTADDDARAHPSTTSDAPTSERTDVSTPVVPAANGVSLAGAPAPLAPAADSAPASPAPRATETTDSATLPAAPVALPNARRLRLPKVTTPSLDSLLGSSAKLGLESSASAIGAGVSVRTATSDDGSVTPPVLIGEVPTPRFPDELRAQPIDAEVVVQFRVNEKGRVDASSMQVLQSPHEAFTAAVRNVLSRLRFEPAHSSAPGAKPQAAWVHFRTQFTARK